MLFVGKGDSLQLDIVGIVAILGEGSILRNAQASALSWHHVLPRLIPAPQALLKHEQTGRLPTQTGIVSGVYSGNVRHELNFFTRLLHPGELKRFQIEVVEVCRNDEYDDRKDFIFGVNDYGVLHALSCLGCLMSCALLGLSIWRKDGFALIATILLSLTSTIVGFASRWRLIFKEENPRNPEEVIPDGDVVIYYPGPGAFRVIRCNEVVSRLYFQAEECEYLLNDNWYRALAMVGSATLIFGLICLGNAHTVLQIGFATSYIILNALYWASSAYHEQHHWSHAYTVTPIEIHLPTRKGTKLHDVEISRQAPLSSPVSPLRKSSVQLEANGLPPPNPNRRLSLTGFRKISSLAVPRKQPEAVDKVKLPESLESFTDILWIAIALTRNTRWLRSPIVPDTEVWEAWVAEATRQAAGEPEKLDGKILLPRWDYKAKLKELFTEEKKEKKRRPKWPTLEQLNTLVPPAHEEKPQARIVPIVRAVQARMRQESESTTRAVHFADGAELTISPIDEADERDLM
ncbi:uncharacterized protein PV07_01417 [Cladophialophora immunda]|uniref:Uncharacterized protein n=1 Tax=Cladophialophora immunda TaxID=569365 RepID=A0A0D2CXN6_9EURO|nr:uncharacterized protein PV07_01417 [Cladophialophora immunda]KIW34650.1 hypothetical protein PV07_01417 [Cladophialophora immunda]OQU98706.1 hypothetical protein CLAIMM_04450 [Cladophialophora immunda]